jgi:hypothetical protein
LATGTSWWKPPWWVAGVAALLGLYTILLSIFVYSAYYLETAQVATAFWSGAGGTALQVMLYISGIAFYGHLLISYRPLSSPAGREGRLRVWLWLNGVFKVYSYLDLAVLAIGFSLVVPHEPGLQQQLAITLEYVFLFVVSFIYRGCTLDMAGQRYDQLTAPALQGATSFAKMANLIFVREKTRQDAYRARRGLAYLGTSLSIIDERVEAIGVSPLEIRKTIAVLEILDQSEEPTSLPLDALASLAQKLSDVSNFGEASSTLEDFLGRFEWSKGFQLSSRQRVGTRYDILAVVAATLGGLGALLSALTPVLPPAFGDFLRFSLSSPDTVLALLIAVLAIVSFALLRQLRGPFALLDAMRY